MAADTPRARARAETIDQIKAIARAHLASDGPDLSLRAVARELGVVSSAVYRYFASRDELLTALIVDGYGALADAVDAAEAAVPRRDLAGRWAAIWHAVRDWARERPSEYALLYGSPVPGYAAPQDTIVVAQRPVVLAVGLLREAVERGLEVPRERVSRPVRADLAGIAQYPGLEGVPPALLARGMTMWALLFGAVSFELFGRYGDAFAHPDEYFDHQIRLSLDYLGMS
ncbi:TetR/AcrR family transcriptional regulator [Jatrophihabitans fulvus]